MPDEPKPLKRGQKVWLVNMDRAGLYDVVPATFVEARDEGRTYMVRMTIEYDGKHEQMVVDRRPDDVLPTRKEAVLRAVARCWDVAKRNNERAEQLLVSLSK